MPFGPPAFPASARFGIGSHEPTDHVMGQGAGSGYSPYIMNMLGLNKKKPWTPGRGQMATGPGPVSHGINPVGLPTERR